MLVQAKFWICFSYKVALYIKYEHPGVYLYFRHQHLETTT